jgi:hypothetical protein
MFRDRSFARAVVLALSVHGLLRCILGLVQRGHGECTAAVARELDVGVWVLEPTEPKAGNPGRLDAAPPRTETAALERRTWHAGVMVPAIVANDAVPDAVVATSQRTASIALAQLEPVPNQQAEVAPGAPHRPTWSRAQLGLGGGNYASALPEESPIKAEMQARIGPSRRLERSIRQDAADRSGRLGLGQEGPILGKLEELALQNGGDLTGYATIAARLFANGAVEMQLLGTSGDDAAWTRLLDRAKRELVAQRLKAPNGSRGIDLEIRVDSRIQLPSGADPGFSVKVFGLPLRKGEGKRSPGIEVLSSLPRLTYDENEKDPALRQRLEMDVLKVPLDLADLSGKRSRIVSARVLKRTVF